MPTRRERMQQALQQAARRIGRDDPTLAAKLRDLSKPGKPGGFRAGRPTMFEGPRVKVSVKITEDAFKVLEDTQRELEPEFGVRATVAAAFEFLIWKGIGREGKLKKRRVD